MLSICLPPAGMAQVNTRVGPMEPDVMSGSIGIRLTSFGVDVTLLVIYHG